MEKKAFALLFTVIADIDSSFDLFRHDLLQGGTAGMFNFGCIDWLRTRAPGIKPGQPGRTREASGMSCENTVVTAEHGGSGSNRANVTPISKRHRWGGHGRLCKWRDDGMVRLICPTCQNVFAGNASMSATRLLLCMGLFSIF
jgi:hypothetical protein